MKESSSTTLLAWWSRFSSVQSLSRVWLFAIPWIAARQASLSNTNSRSSLRLTSTCLPSLVWPLPICLHGPNIPGSYAILLFKASDLAFLTSHIHNWVLFLLWLCLFFLSGVISPLISSSILGTYWPGEFIFQCRVFLPFHTVHGVLKAQIYVWIYVYTHIYLFYTYTCVYIVIVTSVVSQCLRGSLVAHMLQNPPLMWETWISSLG